MVQQNRSSRVRFRQYRRQVRDRRATQHQPGTAETSGAPGVAVTKSTHRSRGLVELFREFWVILRGHRRTLLITLATLSVATLLGLLPLYATKLVFDNVLGGQPLPPGIPAWLGMPTDPKTLLGWVAVAMVILSVGSLAIGMWGRWQATRISKRVAVAARRRMFEHAIRLPLHRVYELKSGGLSSMLREDAGASAIWSSP